jgi:hypothetical protein
MRISRAFYWHLWIIAEWNPQENINSIERGYVPRKSQDFHVTPRAKTPGSRIWKRALVFSLHTKGGSYGEWVFHYNRQKCHSGHNTQFVCLFWSEKSKMKSRLSTYGLYGVSATPGCHFSLGKKLIHQVGRATIYCHSGCGHL